MPANSDSTTAGKERIGKSKPYPAGTTCNNNAFHLFHNCLLPPIIDELFPSAPVCVSGIQ